MGRPDVSEFVRQAMPGTRREVMIRSGVGSSSVGLWLRTFYLAGEAHIAAWQRSTGGGGMQPVYAAGPGRDARQPAAYTPLENARRAAAKRLKDGRIEDRNARRRARAFADRAKNKPHDWAAALFMAPRVKEAGRGTN